MAKVIETMAKPKSAYAKDGACLRGKVKINQFEK